MRIAPSDIILSLNVFELVTEINSYLHDKKDKNRNVYFSGDVGVKDNVTFAFSSGNQQ